MKDSLGVDWDEIKLEIKKVILICNNCIETIERDKIEYRDGCDRIKQETIRKIQDLYDSSSCD